VMGYLLRRMIRDGAPAAWSPLMRLVAMEIADDARDPGDEIEKNDDYDASLRYGVARDSGSGTDYIVADKTGTVIAASCGMWPMSWLPVEGRFGSSGKWRDGLTERCGIGARRISAALSDLAAAGYEMRRQLWDDSARRPVTDKRGRPVFAYRGRSMTFEVPPLLPRTRPESTSDLTTFRPERSSDPVLKVVRSDDPSPLIPSVRPSPQLPNGSAVNSPVEGSGPAPRQDPYPPDTTTRQGTERARMAAADALTQWARDHPEPGRSQIEQAAWQAAQARTGRQAPP
jgi:hypothetical protein